MQILGATNLLEKIRIIFQIIVEIFPVVLLNPVVK